MPHDALAITDHAALAELVPLAEAATSFAKQARSDATRRAYSQQWARFASWCDGHGLMSCPARPETVALYLTAAAQDGLSVSTMSLALTAIATAHRTSGHESPRGAVVVQETWRGIKRSSGGAQRRVAPVVATELRRMVAALPDGVRGVRDRALLVVGFAGAFRRSELAALQVADVDFTDDGVVVALRRSKVDQEGRGVTVGLPFGSDKSTCPVRTLRAWIEVAELADGPLFRALGRWGDIRGGLCGRDVARVVKAAASGAGLDPAKYSGHSLRAGLATTAAKAGKSDRSIMRQGRWSSRTMVDRYVREATLLDGDNAAAGIGL